MRANAVSAASTFGASFDPVADWVWYQGENDMHGVKGNALAKTGYACAQVALVNLWRKEWSAVKGTTSPAAPFGIVAIPGSGTEGGPNLGAMNQAQTGSYGSLPSPVMPATFIAETYDLNDPWGDKTCTPASGLFALPQAC